MKKFITSILILLCAIPCWILYGLMYVACIPLALWSWLVDEIDPYDWVYNITDQFPLH
jgi:hypothetical protein